MVQSDSGSSGSGSITHTWRPALRIEITALPKTGNYQYQLTSQFVQAHNPVDPPAAFAVGLSPSSVAVADVGNGWPGLIVTNAAGGTVSVLLGNGDGTFQTQRTFSRVQPVLGCRGGPQWRRPGGYSRR